MSALKDRIYVLAVCTALVLIGRATLAEPNPSAPPPPPNMAPADLSFGRNADKLDRALDAYLTTQAALDRFSGVVLVAKQGVPIFRKAYGFADRANKRPNTVRTRFNLGSLNKLFTRAAIDQLVTAGRLARTDTLGELLPDYPEQLSWPATVEQLIDMTAGLNDLFGPEFAQAPKDRFRSNADYYDFVSKLPAQFAPGTRMEHCNGCYIALGAIIERIMLMPYEQYMSEYIFKPAGMAHTASIQVDDIERNVAIGYMRTETNGLRSNVFMHGASGSAAGGDYSTADDLLAFINASRNGTLPRIPPSIRAIGSNAGVSTALSSDPTWTVIALANLDPPAADEVVATIFDALKQVR